MAFKVFFKAFLFFSLVCSVVFNSSSKADPHEDRIQLDNLPDELRLKIVGHLPLKDRGAVARVSKSWNALAEDERLWRPYVEKLSSLLDLNITSDEMDFEQQKLIVKEVFNVSFVNFIINHKYKKRDKEREAFVNQCAYLGYMEAKRIKIAGCIENLPRASQGQKSKEYRDKIEEIRKLNDELILMGDQMAKERKFIDLISPNCSGDFYIYDRDKKEAVRCNDLWADDGDPFAIQIKLEGLKSNLWYPSRFQKRLSYHKNPYTQNLEEFVKYNNKLAEAGDLEARRRKFEGLLKGESGYNRDLEEAVRCNEEWAKNGDPEALKRRFEGLLKGWWGYHDKKDEKKAAEINDQWANEGDPEARKRKFEGLLEGESGYDKDISAAHKYNDEWAEAGDLKARERKFEGLYRGKYGYNQDISAAHKWNDEWAASGDLEARERKFFGLLYGYFGYEKKPGEALRCNDVWAEAGDLKARERKFEGLFEGTYGYEKDPEEALRCNDKWANQGDLVARQRKVEFSLSKIYEGKKYNLLRDKRDLLICNQKWANEGDQKARKREFEELACYNNYHLYGIENRRELNDKWAAAGDLDAIKRKVEGLLLGEYGYKQRQEFIDNYLILLGMPASILQKSKIDKEIEGQSENSPNENWNDVFYGF